MTLSAGPNHFVRNLRGKVVGLRIGKLPLECRRGLTAQRARGLHHVEGVDVRRVDIQFRRNPGCRWLLWEKEPDFARALQNSTDFLEETGLL